MIRTQVYLPQSQISYLKDLAVSKDTSISEELRTALDQARRATANKEKSIKKVKSSAQWLLEGFDKIKYNGPKDLATNVDKYLYGDN